jgi:hypothetical protein
MTRIDDEINLQRYDDQARAEKDTEEKRRTEDRSFERLVQQKRQAEQRQVQQKQMQRHAGKSAASQALLARRGIQSQKFQETLQQQADETIDQAKSGIQERTGDLRETKKSSDKKSEVEDRRKVDKQEGDKLAERYDRISRDDPRKNQQGGSMGGDTDSNADKKGFSAGQSTAAVAGTGASVAPEEVAPSSMLRLPPEVIQKIVERVMVGVNTEGLNEFHIQFHEHVLSGSSLSVTAKDGKITARFTTDDVNVKRLLKASEGELSRVFHQKGLYLDRLEVTGP